MASLGCLIGMLMLLNALQLYYDIQYLFTEKKDDVISPSYLEINKKVSLLNTLSVASSGFSPEEIADLRKQRFVKRVEAFTPSMFSIWAKGEVAGTPGIQFDMFLEGLPTDIIDVKSRKWDWQPGEEVVPIIIPSHYMALYNFAFAPSKGLPQLTKETVSSLTLKLEIRNKQGEKVYYKARVLDYSDRINTIMAPLSFIEWANKEYGEKELMKNPSRLLLEVDNPGNEKFVQYLSDKGYETNKDKLKGGKQLALLQIVLLVIGIVGVLIVVLSVMVFVLTFELLISRASGDIRLLIQLGFDYTSISRFFNRYFLTLFLGIQGVALLLVLGSRLWLTGIFDENGLAVEGLLNWMVLVWDALFIAAFAGASMWAIHRTVKRLAE